MSFVIANPEMLAAAATDLAGIVGSMLAAASGPCGDLLVARGHGIRLGRPIGRPLR